MWQYSGQFSSVQSLSRVRLFASRIEQLHRTESQDINPYLGGQVIFSHECQDNPVGERVIFSANGARTAGRPQARG